MLEEKSDVDGVTCVRGRQIGCGDLMVAFINKRGINSDQEMTFSHVKI